MTCSSVKWSKPVRLLVWLPALFIQPWILGLIHYGYGLGLLSAFLVHAGSLLLFVLLFKWRRVRHVWPLALWMAGVAGLLALLLLQPGRFERYRIEQSRMPWAEVDAGGQVRLHDLRAFRREPGEAPHAAWYDLELHADSIRSIDYFLVYFSEVRGVAHSFLSFGFAGGEHVALSIEARRADGEVYALLPGLFRRFDLMYVLGDEPDLVGLRLTADADPIYRLPVVTPHEKMRGLFLNMLRTANRLKKEPEFYNVLTRTCTTRLVDEINLLREDPIPSWHWRLLLPGYSGELARELGLIESERPVLESLETWRLLPEWGVERDRKAFSRAIRP